MLHKHCVLLIVIVPNKAPSSLEAVVTHILVNTRVFLLSNTVHTTHRSKYYVLRDFSEARLSTKQNRQKNIIIVRRILGTIEYVDTYLVHHDERDAQKQKTEETRPTLSKMKK